MNLIQALVGLGRKDERPLHVGEVMSLWKVAAAFEDGRTIILGLLNHTNDAELKRFMESYISDKAKADADDVPPAARFESVEIATMLAAELLAGIQSVQEGALQCLRYDLGSMLLELEAAAYRQSFVLREMMEKRGWLKLPPPWHGSKASH